MLQPAQKAVAISRKRLRRGRHRAVEEVHEEGWVGDRRPDGQPRDLRGQTGRAKHEGFELRPQQQLPIGGARVRDREPRD